ncbi:FecR family protein [Luteimonas sp. SDU101]|uniref:FecR family protein n=1 Tax=Luteimonas sp. SDU101 TaxID=3422593 RepID=UPI003EBF6DC3
MRTARAEASAWIARLHGPDRDADMEAGFRRWLAERPENALEFEGLNEVWELLPVSVPSRATARLERWERSEEARQLQAMRTRTSTPARPQTRFALAVCAALVLVALGAFRFWPDPSYATAVGEQRTVRLEDGTRVSLNSGSRVSVAYGDAERRVRLARGEVLFDVARDAERPFVVDVEGHRVTALGTSFVVRRDDERVAVTLIEGRVAVVPASAAARGTGSRAGVPASSPGILAPGQRMTLAARAPARIDSPRLDAVTAWRRGEVILDDTPLTEAVAEMNRYDRTAIVIDRPEARTLTVSGLYHTGDSAGFAESVAQMYGLRVVERDGRIHLR